MEKNLIKQVITDQKLDLLSGSTDLRPRAQSIALRALLTSKLVKVIMGIRRSGKSSLCQNLINDYKIAYVNFDDERFASLTTTDLNSIYEILKELEPDLQYIFFDEIQNVEKWELFINRLQRKKENLILTGSNGKLLSGDLATHLTGRQISLNLFPLSFSEFLVWKKAPNPPVLSTENKAQLSREFEFFFTTGGFPEVVLGENPHFYLQELFDKIISKDIAQRYKLREVKNIKELACYLIQNSGQFISGNTLKKSFGIKSLSSVQKYLQYLMDSYLIFELRGYSYKLKERSTAPRKVYAPDLAMIRALWSKPTQDLGAKLETLVFLELIKAGYEIYYLHEDNVEIDFCVLSNGKISSLIQVSYDLSNPKTLEREIRALVKLGKKHKIQNLLIITRDESREIISDGQKIQIITAYEYFRKPQ